jgi:hypothetical protein
MNSIYSSVKKRRGKAKILSLVLVGIGTDKNGNKIESKIVNE